VKPERDEQYLKRGFSKKFLLHEEDEETAATDNTQREVPDPLLDNEPNACQTCQKTGHFPRGKAHQFWHALFSAA
jgi:hypothetical protein